MGRAIGWGLIAILAFGYLVGALDLLGEVAGPRTTDSDNRHTWIALLIVGVGSVVWFASSKNRH